MFILVRSDVTVTLFYTRKYSKNVLASAVVSGAELALFLAWVWAYCPQTLNGGSADLDSLV